jgi:hypothetical protein
MTDVIRSINNPRSCVLNANNLYTSAIEGGAVIKINLSDPNSTNSLINQGRWNYLKGTEMHDKYLYVVEASDDNV